MNGWNSRRSITESMPTPLSVILSEARSLDVSADVLTTTRPPVGVNFAAF